MRTLIHFRIHCSRGSGATLAQTALALATSTALALTSAIVIVIAIARDEHGLCQVRVLKAYHIRVLQWRKKVK